MKTKSPVSQHIRTSHDTDPKPGLWFRNVNCLKTVFIYTIRTCSRFLLGALLHHHGPHTRHQWFWCCGVLLGKEPITSWCNKQNQGFQTEAEFFLDPIRMLDVRSLTRNINVLHWTGPPLTQWAHTEPLTRVQSAAERGPNLCTVQIFSV